MDCGSCRSMAGEITLTNGPRLVLDDHWLVEHVHPCGFAGWLVLVLRRHARALHELDEAEASSLGHWLPRLTSALHDVTGSELEYVMQFAEGAGFHHVHFHLIARTPEWPDGWRGPNVFEAMKTDTPVSAVQVTALVEAVGVVIGVEAVPLS